MQEINIIYLVVFFIQIKLILGLPKKIDFYFSIIYNVPKEDSIMNKLSKILLTFVIILVISLIIMTILFFKMKNLAYYNYTMYESQKNLSNYLEKQLEE